MNPKRDILNEHLKVLDPVSPGDLDDNPPQDIAARILATDPDEGKREVNRHWRSDRRLVPRWALVPAVLALVAAFVMAVGLSGGDEGGESVTAALGSVATAAAAQGPSASDGPYLFLKTRSMSVDTAVAQGKTWSVLRSETRQEWASPDGAGLVRTETEPPTFVGLSDRVAWEAAGSPNFAPLGAPTHTSEEALPPGSIEDVSDLPTDPDALAQQLHTQAEATHGSAPVPARVLELIGEALRTPTASPELRAALYEAALQVPGIEYLGPATDTTGREGVAVGMTSSYSGEPTVFSLIYDPRSTEVLANEQITESPKFVDVDGPLVTSATVYLRAGTTIALPK